MAIINKKLYKRYNEINKPNECKFGRKDIKKIV